MNEAIRSAILDQLAQAGIALSDSAVSQLFAYYTLLSKWNEKTNLTALPLNPPTPSSISRLIVEPVAAAHEIQEAVVGRWFDLGSGGGSPAIPMKVVRPDLRLTMTESRSRKAAFLREAIRSLGLSADVLCVRFEELEADFEGSAGLITIRAVRMDPSVWVLLERLLHPDGLLVWFGHSEGETRDGYRLRAVRDDPFAKYRVFQRVRSRSESP